MNIEKIWIKSVITLMDQELRKEDLSRILEKCGRGCALGCGIVEKIQNADLNSKNPEEILQKLRSPELFGERIFKGNDCYYTTCEQCFCPYVNDSTEETPDSYCECTKGWTKQVFESAFGRPAEVEIEQTIIRGADYCKMKIRLG
jgi:hypothetical protein